MPVEPIGFLYENTPAIAEEKQAISEDMAYTMKTINFIKDKEKFRSKGYFATKNEKKNNLVTIGYGSTGRVAFGEKVTEEQAFHFLTKDIISIRQSLDNLITVPLSHNQRAAITSLVYNIGRNNFSKSEALKLLNSGDIAGFTREAFDSKRGFVYGGGKKLKGLVKRRNAERKLFQK